MVLSSIFERIKSFYENITKKTKIIILIVFIILLIMAIIIPLVLLSYKELTPIEVK
jgi:hypothetical protein